MQASNEIFLHNGSNSPHALYHLSRTFEQVRHRLQSESGLSDGSIGIVLSLVIQEQVRGQTDAAEVHFAGMQKMIELRGGLEKLGLNTELVLKICK